MATDTDQVDQDQQETPAEPQPSPQDQWLQHPSIGVSPESFRNPGGDEPDLSQTFPSTAFSPEAFYVQTLQSLGYSLGTDPALDQCWEEFHRCLDNSTDGQQCLTNLRSCQTRCAIAPR